MGRSLRPRLDITGVVSGRLTATGNVKHTQHAGWLWECICECGNTSWVTTSRINTGRTRSCGCLNRENIRKSHTKHGLSKKYPSEYSSWTAMHSRCSSTSNNRYEYYGGRGIKVCDRWSDFALFMEDMGTKPGRGYSVERLDVDDMYTPDNCVWATDKDQANNKTTNIVLHFSGESLTAAQWGERLGICPKIIRQRKQLGWGDERCLFSPIANKQMTSEQVSQARLLNKEGRNFAEIGRTLGFSGHTIAKAVRGVSPYNKDNKCLNNYN